MKNKKEYIKSDIYRYYGKYKLSIYEYLTMPPQLRYFQLLRKYQCSSNKFYRLFLKIKARNIQKKIQLDIPLATQIDCGLIMYHSGNVAINSKAVIGKNVTISPGLVVGHSKGGKRHGYPIIGNDVWIGQNVAIVGGVTIGSNVLIAPNTYININIPNNSIVFGNPCVVKYSSNPTEMYINNRV